MRRTRSATRFLIACGLLASWVPASPAGVNRWSSSGPITPSVRRVVIDPSDPEGVLACASDFGLFQSRDNGRSWTNLSAVKPEGIGVYSAAVDPQWPSTILAGTGRGVSRSRDRGATWSDSLKASAIHNLIFGSQKSTVYAADFDDVSYYPAPSVVYRSTDGGETWSSGIPGFAVLPGTLTLDPIEPLGLYASAAFGGVYKSKDGGTTWRLASPDLSSIWISSLAVDPSDPFTVYAGSWFRIYRSTDAGLTWRVLSAGLEGKGLSALVVDPRNPRTLYAATGSGVYRSLDGGSNWREFNTGLPRVGFATLAIDRTGRKLHAGSYRGGVFDYQVSGVLDLSVSADHTARLLFAPSEGEFSMRGIDPAGNVSEAGPFGPYGGWNTKAVADGADGLTRVLWTHDDGTAALWLLGPEGNRASFRLGPAAGWTAVDVSASASGVSHVLWSNADGRVAVSTIDNTGGISPGLPYGPYPGWRVVAAADDPLGATRLLWNHSDGSAAISRFPPEEDIDSHRFGPVEGWTALDAAVGADGQTRILWSHRDGRMALWRIDDAGTVTAAGPIYPAIPGFAASRIAAGPDGRVRVLWTGPEGAVLWLMSAENLFEESFPVVTSGL